MFSVMFATFALVTLNVRRKYVVMKWLPTGPPSMIVASSFSCPSLYPSCAGPDSHEASLNAFARHPVPWSEPFDRYFHTAPGPMSEVFVTVPPFVAVMFHDPVCALNVAGRPFTSTETVLVESTLP